MRLIPDRDLAVENWDNSQKIPDFHGGSMLLWILFWVKVPCGSRGPYCLHFQGDMGKKIGLFIYSLCIKSSCCVHLVGILILLPLVAQQFLPNYHMEASGLRSWRAYEPISTPAHTHTHTHTHTQSPHTCNMQLTPPQVFQCISFCLGRDMRIPPYRIVTRHSIFAYSNNANVCLFLS
jgi:hypothetical protein